MEWWAARAVAAASHGTCYVADVGSNGGFFTLLSRAIGCRVLAVDAQPRCLERLASAAAVNGFASGVTTVWSAVGPNASAHISVGATRCSGLWGVVGADWIDAESSRIVSVGMRSFTEILMSSGVLPDGAALTLLKIDTEGSEIAVLKSALPVLRARRVAGILVEVVPARVAAISPAADVIGTFTAMYETGYACSTDATTWMALGDLLAVFREGATVVGEQWVCALTNRTGHPDSE